MTKREGEREVQHQGNANKIQRRDEIRENISRKLTLKDMPEAIKELNQLAPNQTLDDTLDYINQELRESEFYKRLTQGVTELDASKSGLLQSAKILLASLATSFKLHILNFSGNNLGASGVDIARILSKSTTLQDIDLSNNKLDKFSLNITKSLLKIPTLTTLSMRDNALNLVGADFNDERHPSPEYVADIVRKAEIKKIICCHNQEVNLRVQLVNTLNELQFPSELIKIMGDYYYYYENHIELDL